jgi:hypothetical protein
MTFKMVDLVTVVVVGIAGVVFYLKKTNVISIPNINKDEERIDLEPNKEYGLNLREFDIVDCPDGMIRFNGAKRNNDGKWDIRGMEDEWVRGVDPNVNLLPIAGEDLLLKAAGVGRIRCNVKISDGRAIPWDHMNINTGNLTFLQNAVQKLEQERTNLLHLGFHPQEGPSFFKNFDDVTNNIGTAVKKLGISKSAGADTAGTKLGRSSLPYGSNDEEEDEV